MRHVIILIITALLVCSCKTSSAHCDAYGSVEKKIDKSVV